MKTSEQTGESHVDSQRVSDEQATGGQAPADSIEESRGLRVDMLDVDRLREWARLLLVHGADIGHWGSVPFVAGKMQTMATDLEQTVRDVGVLRSQRDELIAALKTAAQAINPPDIGGIALVTWNDRLKAATVAINAALAKAEGR